jgi:hypothetical protein
LLRSRHFYFALTTGDGRIPALARRSVPRLAAASVRGALGGRLVGPATIATFISFLL